MLIKIRKFESEDIRKKVEWINDPENNRFLHYDIPLEVEKTRQWFYANIGRTDRWDGVIEADGIPCGLIGLLSIDRKNSKAEYYITIGEASFKRKDVALQASRLILDYGFKELGLNRIYLFTETENIAAQALFEKVGFIREGCLRNDIMSHGRLVDRFVYGICRSEYLKED